MGLHGMHKLSRARDGQSYLLVGPYIEDDTPAMVAKLTKLVPASCLTWHDKPLEAWRVDSRWALEVQRMLDEHYGVTSHRETIERLSYLVRLWRSRWRPLATSRKRRIQREHGIAACEGCSRPVNMNGDGWIVTADECVLHEGCATENEPQD